MPGGQQVGRGLALEQQTLLGHLHQDEAHQLPHVHPTDHLLEPAQRSAEPLRKQLQLNSKNSFRSTQKTASGQLKKQLQVNSKNSFRSTQKTASGQLKKQLQVNSKNSFRFICMAAIFGFLQWTQYPCFKVPFA